MVRNPWRPDWYLLPLVFDAYRRGDEQGALGEWNRLNLPELYWTHLLGVMINGQLGNTAEAAAARASLLALFPNYAETAVRDFQVCNLEDPPDRRHHRRPKQRQSGRPRQPPLAALIHVLAALIHELTTPCLRKLGYSRFSCGQLFWAHGPVPAICGV
jgi:hypothetical protein